MSPSFRYKTGIVTGRDHILASKNCQDAVRSMTFLIGQDEYIVSFLCDGCSSGSYSEVGANLGAEFLVRQVRSHLLGGLSVAVAASVLYSDLKEYLWWLLNAQLIPINEQPKYIQDFLLFTVIGVIVGPSDTVTISAGDGLVVVNENIQIMDFDNEPPYVAYHLVDQDFLSPTRRQLPDNFEIILYKTEELERVAIGSDAWTSYQPLIDELWGLEHPNAVQRKMNVWSGIKHYLQDDASIVIIERDKGRVT